MLTNLKSDLSKAFEHLKNEFAKLQVGRANPALVEWIPVSAYGSLQPLKNSASVSVIDSQTLSIQPWDKSLLREIAKAITDAWLGLNPQDNGESIMLKIPTLTEERRRDLVKVSKKIAEEGKITIRNIRQDYLKHIKTAETAKTISEDVAKGFEADLQKEIDAYTKQVEDLAKHKEEEIMKV